MPEWALLAGCEVDHIISRKHGGLAELANLALSCARCNRAKGSDVGSVSDSTGAFVRLFNPRTDRWEDHFKMLEGRIGGLTEIGTATARLLRMNAGERVIEIGAEAARLKVRASHAVEDATIEGKRFVKRSRHAAEDLVDDAAYRIKRDPLRSVAITLAVGLGIGALAGWLAGRRGRR